MRHPFTAAFVAGVGLVVLSATGCAPGQPSSEPEPSGSGDCAFEVRNETDEALNVTAGGSEIRQLGTLEPGRSVRFQESCDVDEVRITATSAQTTEPGFGPGSEGARDRVVQRRAAPRPGYVVRVPLRFPEQVRGNRGGIDGGRVPAGGWGGWDSLPPSR